MVDATIRSSYKRLMRIVLAVLGAALMGLGAGTANGAYPGKNGAIVFARSGDLWTIRPDGSGLTRLTRTATREGNPAWSPDGTKLAYDSRGSIFVANADGKDARNITAVGSEPDVGNCDSEPTWSPDGKQIAFSFVTDDCTGAAGGLGAMAADGSDRRVLEEDYAGVLGGDTEPAWSPGGARLVFTRSDSERMASGPYVYNVWVLDTRTGKALRALTKNGDSEAPSWRPNGKQIAFEGPKGITVMTAAGTSPTVLARGRSPAWSPDAGQIVYLGTDGLHLVRTNGSRAQRLLLRCSCGPPDWQPLPR
jgi:Tol biopolymer transport system component